VKGKKVDLMKPEQDASKPLNELLDEVARISYSFARAKEILRNPWVPRSKRIELATAFLKKAK
jgi:hypothetical protein